MYPRTSVDLLGLTTQGDQILDRPLAAIGGKGLFIKELEVAMTEGRADLAVHSLKDVPMEMPPGFALAAIAAREDPRDAFVSQPFAALADLPDGARSSARRACGARRSCASVIPALEVGRCAATSTRGCASSTRASTTRSSSPRPD